jgi:uncharacterized Zn finger protein (UPF0148 family)
MIAGVLCERCAKPAAYLYARDGKLICIDCVTAAAVRAAQDGCLEERRHDVLARAEKAEHERDEARADAEHARAANTESKRQRDVALCALQDIRSYLAHAGQDADLAFVVNKYVDPARKEMRYGGAVPVSHEVAEQMAAALRQCKSLPWGSIIDAALAAYDRARGEPAPVVRP